MARFGGGPGPLERTLATLLARAHDAWSRRRPPEIPVPSAAELTGLREDAAPLSPPGVAPHVQTTRLSRGASAGGGYVAGEDGLLRPHYWGHRARLRDRALRGGMEALPDYELLKMILFDAIPRVDVKPLAKRLLATFGDLAGLCAASREQILRVDGATERVFLQLGIARDFARRLGHARVIDREVLSSWDALVDYCRLRMAALSRESFRCLFLDRRNVLIADEELGRGTVNHVPVYPREVARRALELEASAIVLVHNHPSGDPEPSGADIEMTVEIMQACRILGITVHDHLIVGRAGETSFRSAGLLKDLTVALG